MHGYQIIQEVTERSSGSWTPSPGSVYPTLQQLEDEELVRADESAGRRVYHLTDAGREQAAALSTPTPWAMAEGDDELAALRDSLFQVMAAVRQIAQTGGERELAAAQDVLREARKQLYRLLAEDTPDKTE
jgi:DNA-binding PadR family transcriptional regulator